MFGLNRYQLLCLAYITFGSALYGYDSGKLDCLWDRTSEEGLRC